MNAGAATASGGVLLFLHADSRLGPSAVPTLVREMERSGRSWGRFDAHRRRRPDVEARRRDDERSLAPHRHRNRRPGPLRRAVLFAAIGGYPRQALMEDIELSKRLKRAGGPPLCLARASLDIGSPLGKSRDVANDHHDVATALCLLAQCRPGPVGRGIPTLAIDGSARAADLRQSARFRAA